MATELELKAVVSDPVALQRSLRAAGARETFRGMLRNRRLDATGRLTAADAVLRLRRWVRSEGEEAAEIGWKGPGSVSTAGYKHRQEIEGPPPAIESLIAVAGLRRAHCTPDSLSTFVGRYEARTGRKAVLAEADLAGEPPSWAAG